MVAVLALASPAASALEAGTFTRYPLQPSSGAAGMQLTRLAVLDASPQSRQWLRSNADYLLAQQIPVMIVHSGPREAAALMQQYQGSGLLIGAAPEPPELLDAVLHRLGVEQYPAVMKTGWCGRCEMNPCNVRHATSRKPSPSPRRKSRNRCLPKARIPSHRPRRLLCSVSWMRCGSSLGQVMPQAPYPPLEQACQLVGGAWSGRNLHRHPVRLMHEADDVEDRIGDDKTVQTQQDHIRHQ